jgi:hydrogenase maturation protease
MNRIICIGNRYLTEDAAGYEIYLRLQQLILPDYVELVDGGLGGLDLLRFVEGCRQVVFVDNVQGFGRPGEIVILGAKDVAKLSDKTFEHAAGLPYLLRILPQVCDGPVPHVRLVGIEGPVEGAVYDDVAQTALRLASDRLLADPNKAARIQSKRIELSR